VGLTPPDRGADGQRRGGDRNDQLDTILALDYPAEQGKDRKIPREMAAIEVGEMGRSPSPDLAPIQRPAIELEHRRQRFKAGDEHQAGDRESDQGRLTKHGCGMIGFADHPLPLPRRRVAPAERQAGDDERSHADHENKVTTEGTAARARSAYVRRR
jgi:hypothetical protein